MKPEDAIEALARGVVRACLDLPAVRKNVARKTKAAKKPKSPLAQVQERMPFITDGEPAEAPDAQDLDALFGLGGVREPSPPPPHLNPPPIDRGLEYADVSGDAPENGIAGIHGY
jgi:hypothetical protein